MRKQIREFRRMIRKSRNIVFFGGAGVSTESGIPDFRSTDGLYNQQYKYPPERILSRNFFLKEPEEFYEFYKNKMVHRDAKPSITHLALARLEKKGRLNAVLTQNIDGLHQIAGSKNVIELHGTIYKNYCMNCDKFFSIEDIMNADGVPRCECGGIIKPEVVLYEEGLNEENLKKAVEYVRKADMLIVGGTSLGVYPAAGLIDYYKGNRLVLINKTATPYDKKADLLINGALGKVFGSLDI